MDASAVLADLGETVDLMRVAATKQLNPERRAEFGQVLTPHFVAKLMADRLSLHRSSIRLLDPGAGIGSLTAAIVQRILHTDERPKSVHVDAFEIDPTLVDLLNDTLKLCTTHLAGSPKCRAKRQHFRMRCST
jgi:adenine-specific DNA-methyltransferase